MDWKKCRQLSVMGCQLFVIKSLRFVPLLASLKKWSFSGGLLFTGYCLLFIVNGCGVYNFTGASLAPDVKTMSITNFVNETALGPPRMAQNFTEKIREYFLSNTSVKLVKTEGDLKMEGAITGYAISPIAPTGNEFASKNRLTIRVRVVFENAKDTATSFKQEFSFYDDYDQKLTLSQVEDQEVETITNQIVFDIFNKALSNW